MGKTRRPRVDTAVLARRICSVDFRLLPVRDGDIVLDLGCGSGRHTLQACRQSRCSIVAVDLNREALRGVRYMWAIERCTDPGLGYADFFEADAQRLPFSDNCFDRIFCTEVLEHLPDYRACIRELVRVLKPSGAIAVSVPAFFVERLIWFLPGDYRQASGGHIRIYTPSQLKKALLANGLRLYAIRYEKSLQSLYWLLICLSGYDRQATLPQIFRDFLEMFETSPNHFMDRVESVGNFIIPKDMVFYARKGKGNRRSQ